MTTSPRTPLLLDAHLLIWACCTTAAIGHYAAVSSWPIATYYTVAFVVALTGTCMGMRHLRGGAWFLAQRTPLSRAATELSSVFLWAAAPAATFILPMAFHADFPPGPGLGGSEGAVSMVRITGIAFFLLRCPLPTRLLPLALVALTWWIPALIPALAGLFDASPRLASALDRQNTLAALAPVGALILAALLFPHPRGTPQ